MQHLVKQERHVKASRTYTNPYKYNNNTNATDDRCFGGQLYSTWGEFGTKTDKTDAHSQADTLPVC